MPQIVEKCGRDSFKFYTSVLRVVLKFDHDMGDVDAAARKTREETREETGEETREETREKILKILRQTPSVTAKALADLLSLTQQGVEWNLKKLKEQGLIRRIGPNKGGHWEVIEPGAAP
jgi:predicted HTH transcriptional regulator